jgi:hypothetical protein
VIYYPKLKKFTLWGGLARRPQAIRAQGKFNLAREIRGFQPRLEMG